MGRAERRHHNERVKARFYRINKLSQAWPSDEYHAGLYANHGCNCSCHMCGNPRRHFKQLTMQERKASQESFSCD